VSTTAQFPHGIVCMVPTQVPAKRLCFELGCCLAGFEVDSVAPDFGVDLGNFLCLGFADCFAGVGVSTSEIGAGSRCDPISKSRAVQSERRIVRLM